MRTSLVALFTIVALACVVGSTAVTANDEVALTVSVVDQNDTSVSGAVVEATWDGGEATGTTASNGRVFIDVPQGADVELDIDDERYVRNKPLLVSNAEEQDVELRVFPHGQAAVTVVDTDGQPLSEATVRLRQGGSTMASGKTDGDGVFRSNVVEQGEYSVSAVKPEYYEANEDIRVEEETEAEIVLEGGRVTLDIEVVDDHFEPPQPLSDARVRVEADQFDADVSATDGSASLNVPVNTRYRVEASKDGYDGTPRQLPVREEPRSVTVNAQRTPELVATAESTRVIVGERTRIGVANAYDEPVSGVAVRLNGEQVGETDDRGEISVQIDSTGEKTITASDGQLESDPITLTGIDPDAESEEPDDASEETPTDTSEETPTESPEETPGFGVAIAVVALAIAFAGRAMGSR